MAKTLEQHTPEELAAEAQRLQRAYGRAGGTTEYFRWLTALRQECFERLAAAMDPGGALGSFVEQMTARHGPKVRVFRTPLSWPAALAVVRYGEAPASWPAAFSPEDIERAMKWLYRGGVPEGITYITVEG